MNRSVSLALVCFSGLSAASQPQPQPPPTAPQRIVVLPFAALSGEVPEGGGAKAAAMLITELKNAGGLEVGPTPTSTASRGGEALAAARAAMGRAREDFTARRLTSAAAEIAKALERYGEAVNELPPAEAVDRLSEGYEQQAAIAFLRGRDDEGRRHLDALASLTSRTPKRTPDLIRSSALFTRELERARARVSAAEPASVAIESIPPGAAAFIDGAPVGRTPIRVAGLVPGPHLWTVMLPGHGRTGALVELRAGQVTSARATPDEGGDVGRVQAALSRNELSAPVVAALEQVGRGARAELLIFGVLAPQGSGLSLASFLWTKGALRRLPALTFDMDLLSAGVELFRLAGEVAQKRAAAGEAVSIPARAHQAPIASPALPAEVRFAPVTPDEDPQGEPDGEPDAGPRAPLRKPLRRR